MRIAIITNYTGEWIKKSLAKEMGDTGEAPTFHLVEYEQYAQAILSPNSELHTFAPQWVVMSLLPERLLPGLQDADWLLGTPADEATEAVDKAAGFVNDLLIQLEDRHGCRTIIAGALAPVRGALGIAEATEGQGRDQHLAQLNLGLQRHSAARPQRAFLNLETLARQVGEEQVWDHKGRYLTDNPWSRPFLRAISAGLAHIIRVQGRAAKKVLVLDLDNTIWGGVLTEDGVEKLKIGPEGAGKAYQDLQRVALNLRARGVILCIASKNDEAEALAAIDSMEGNLLRTEHFSAWAISWEDKASGIRSMAESLNLGLAGFVFLDDNPAERALVAELVPEVTVLDFPTNAARLAETLMAYDGFDQPRHTVEDRNRPALYAARKETEQLRTETSNLTDFLRSLDMHLVLEAAHDGVLARVAQLIGKTNQFNMTTIRRSEAEVAALHARGDASVWAIRLDDKFVSHGVVGAAILIHEGDQMALDTFLMSCRVLERGLEQGVIDALGRWAAQEGATRFIADWRRSLKNARYRMALADCGLDIIEEAEDHVRFGRDLSATQAPIEHPFTLTITTSQE